MAIGYELFDELDEVNELLYDELYNAFKVLYNDLMKISKKNAFLIKKNIIAY